MRGPVGVGRGPRRHAIRTPSDIRACAEPQVSVRSLCRIPNRIDELHIGEVPFIVGDDDTAVCLGSRSNDRVECASGASFRLSVRHESRPDEAGPFVEREDAPGEESRWTLRAHEPCFEPIAPVAGGHLQSLRT